MKAHTLVLGLATVMGLSGCSAAAAVPTTVSAAPITVPAEALPADIAADLRYMREEEKLARDVYLTFAERFDLPLFATIADSEQQHADAIGGLLDTFGLEDPLQSAVGAFTNPQLQQLYDDLIMRGTTDAAEAARVGALIEEIDIRDLRDALERTDDPAVTRVYTNLLAASRNHLRAFTRQIERQTGSPYQLQVLDPVDDAGLSAATGRAAGGNTGRGERRFGGR